MTLETLKLSEIHTGGHNPRQSFDDESLKRLSQCIKLDGLLQNLVVTKNGKGYNLIVGGGRIVMTADFDA